MVISHHGVLIAPKNCFFFMNLPTAESSFKSILKLPINFLRKLSSFKPMILKTSSIFGLGLHCRMYWWHIRIYVPINYNQEGFLSQITKFSLGENHSWSILAPSFLLFHSKSYKNGRFSKTNFNHGDPTNFSTYIKKSRKKSHQEFNIVIFYKIYMLLKIMINR